MATGPTKKRISYFYDAEVGNYHYGQGHPMKVRVRPLLLCLFWGRVLSINRRNVIMYVMYVRGRPILTPLIPNHQTTTTTRHKQPHRVRMTHSLVVYYWLYRNMEVSFVHACAA